MGWSGAVSGDVDVTFDADGRVDSRTVSDGSLSDTKTFRYDADGLLGDENPTTGDVGDLRITRNATTGLIERLELGDVETTLTFNAFGELASQTTTRISTSAAIHSATYDTVGARRDLLGRVVTRSETIAGAAQPTVTYAYDDEGRLDTVTEGVTLVRDYAYDDNGNRQPSSPGGPATVTYDAQDRLLDYDGVTYAYTDNGELDEKTDGSDVTAYDYDVFGNLLGVILPSGTEIDYEIDASNRRVGKRVNGTLQQGFLYADQIRVVAELDGSGALVSRFVYGTRPNVPDYMVKGGVDYLIVSDQVGSVRFVVRASDGQVMQELAYDEFGT